MTFDFGTGPKYDSYINYCFGGFMIICVLISTFLNPLIIYSYSQKPKSIQNFLFKVIAVSDFLTNLIPGIFMIYVFFGSVKFERTFLNQLPEFLSCTFGCVSQVTTSLMAVTRMIAIIRPFCKVEFKFVLAYLIFYTIYMGIGNAGSLVITGIKNHRNVRQDLHNISEYVTLGYDRHYNLNMATIETLNKMVCFSMNMAHCILGLLCSIIVVGYLQSRTPIGGSSSHQRKLKVSKTILIMNIPYFISIISNFLAFYQVVEIDFKLVNHYMHPILTSAYNPCVIVARTDAIKVAKRGLRGNVCGVIQFERQTSLMQALTTVSSFDGNRQSYPD